MVMESEIYLLGRAWTIHARNLTSFLISLKHPWKVGKKVRYYPKAGMIVYRENATGKFKRKLIKA